MKQLKFQIIIIFPVLEQAPHLSIGAPNSTYVSMYTPRNPCLEYQVSYIFTRSFLERVLVLHLTRTANILMEIKTLVPTLHFDSYLTPTIKV